MTAELSSGELELLVEGLSDDIAFVYVLLHLGLRAESPGESHPPSPSDTRTALDTLAGLRAAGLIEVGHMAYVDDGPPGRVAPVQHVPDPDDAVRSRVLEACGTGVDWEWSCWVANTDMGDEAARQALGDERADV